MSNDTLSALARYRPLLSDWEHFEQVARSPLPTTFWVNPLHASPAIVADELRSRGLDPQPVPWEHPGAFRLPPGTVISHFLPYLTGSYHQQEEASLVPVRLLDPQPGERVLDMCAAPGGKTLQIAAAMQNRGTVVANDISPKRVSAIRGHLDRLGLINVAITVANASNLPAEIGNFDRVLADVPCSCLGTSRKSLAAERWDLETSLSLVGLQQAILRRAVQLCRRGGRIVYSTCTYAPEENEAVVDAVLREFPGTLRLCPIELSGLRLEPGLTAWEGKTYLPELSETRRLWPHHNDTGGFFVAVLERLDGPDTYATPAPTLPAEGVEERLAECVQCFGFPEDLGDTYQLFRANRKYTYILPGGFLPPQAPQPESMGLRFIHMRGQLAKLTTEGTRLMASQATRNCLALTAAQAEVAVRGGTFALLPRQAEACPEPGYVMLMYGRFTLGLGVRRWPEHLESMVPKELAETASEVSSQKF